MFTIKQAIASGALAIAGAFASAHADPVLATGFDGGVPAGWLTAATNAALNESAPRGSGYWGQGNENIFGAQSGAPSSYLSDDIFAASSLGGAVSDWLLTPVMTLANGITVTFFARVDTESATYPGDVLQLRLSTAGASAAVGTTATSVGDFTTLLRSIDFATATSPFAWTAYTATIGGLTGAVTGRLAFRYVVGDTTTQGSYLGLDGVSVVPEPEPLLLLASGLTLLAVARRRAARR